MGHNVYNCLHARCYVFTCLQYHAAVRTDSPVDDRGSRCLRKYCHWADTSKSFRPPHSIQKPLPTAVLTEDISGGGCRSMFIPRFAQPAHAPRRRHPVSSGGVWITTTLDKDMTGGFRHRYPLKIYDSLRLPLLTNPAPAETDPPTPTPASAPTGGPILVRSAAPATS